MNGGNPLTKIRIALATAAAAGSIFGVAACGPAKAGNSAPSSNPASATAQPSTRSSTSAVPQDPVAKALAAKLTAAFPKAWMVDAATDSFYDNLPAADRPKYEGDLTGAPKHNIRESADVYTAPLPEHSGWTGCNDAVISGSAGGVKWLVSLTSDVHGWPVSPSAVATALGGQLVFHGAGC